MPVINGKKVSVKTGRPQGRPSAEFPKEWETYYSEWKQGKITAKKCMDDMQLKRTTFYKLIKIHEEKSKQIYADGACLWVRSFILEQKKKTECQNGTRLSVYIIPDSFLVRLVHIPVYRQVDN